MLGTIWAYRHSLIIRLILLSFVVLVMLFLQFFILPFWSREPDTLDGAAYTTNMASSIIYHEVTREEGDIQRLKQNEDLRRIAAANPKFRFFVETEKERLAFGGPPRRLELPEGTYVPDPREDAPYPCSDFSAGRFPFHEADTVGWVIFNNCPGKAYYIEVAGVETSPFSRGERIWSFVTSLRFGFFERHLMLGGGILLIALFIIAQAVYSLRKLARVAREFDPGQGARALPEKGLPLEVRPLVRALNDMLSRVEETHEKHNFFLATAAHELRTPLTIIRTRLEELPAGRTKDDLTEDVRDIAALIEQLLRLTRMKSAADMTTDVVDLVAVARTVCARRAPLAIDRGIALELQAPQETVTVWGDWDMIATAIANLVDNALSVSRAGDPLSVEVTPNGEVRVRDRGPGVTAARREEIFQPFTKSPPNRQGHGLGLAIVRAVMTLHKGDVDQKNIPDGGSEFTLYFMPSP